jgi:hypothetical protein
MGTQAETRDIRSICSGLIYFDSSVLFLVK